MAFDLKAVLRLDDKFSDKIRRAQRATERMQQAIQKMQRVTEAFNSATNRTHDNLNRFAGAGKQTIQTMRSMASSLNPLRSGFFGLASAIGGAVAAHKAFDATIGQAARYERSQGLITAMMGNPTKAKKFMEEIERMAINSPLLNSGDMMAAASAFLPMTKDINRLKKLYGLSERLFVLNDREGMEGASFALREFLMGHDAQSLVERFNLNRKVLNDLKNLSFDEAVKGLDDLLNKMGVTRKTIETIGNDTIAKWSQIKERLARTFRQIGEPSLKVVNNFLTSLINRFDSGDLTRFANVGANIVKQIITGMTNTATKIYDWFSALSASEEFKQKTTLWGKVDFVINDIYQRFTEWLNNEGMKKIQTITETLVGTIAKAIENNAAKIAVAALSVGLKIGGAIAKGISDAISNNPLAKAVLGAVVGGVIGSAVPGIGTGFGMAVGAGAALGKHYVDKLVDKYYGLFSRKKSKKYNGGIDYVPYDGMPAILHRGEKVLPRGEANEYRRNKGRAGGVTINIANMQVRQESDIRKIAYELAKLIEKEGALIP